MDISHAEEEAKLRTAEQQHKSVDVTHAEARNAFVLTVRCESNVSLGEISLLPQAVTLERQEKTSVPSRRRPSYWERTEFCTTSRR